MNGLVAAPILIHFATAMLGFCLWKRFAAQRVVSVIGMLAACATSVAIFVGTADGPGGTPTILPLNVGDWAAPYGIVLVADRFSAIMLLLTSVVGLAVLVFAAGSLDRTRASNGFHPLTHTMLAAISGVFVAGDLFNIYVWFEVLLMSSFVLLTLGGERGQLEGAIKYVTLNLMSSTMFLTAVGLLYGMTGTLNLADLSLRLEHADNPKMLTAVGVLFLVGFAIKAGTFPFFFWLPASYHTPPAVVAALFAGVLAKVGVYAIVRLFTLCFRIETDPFLFNLLAIIAGLTMVVGVLGAASQYQIRRILAFHSVSQAGYMLMGAALVGIIEGKIASGAADPGAVEAMRAAQVTLVAGTALFILHHGIVKMSLFLVAGVIQTIKGSDDLRRIGGLYASRPFLGLLFMLPALSLAGIPIFSGFWGKLALVRGGLMSGTTAGFVLVIVSLVVSVLTLYSMTKVWNYGFWRGQPKRDPHADEPEHPLTRRWASQPILAAAPSSWTLGRRSLMIGPVLALGLVALGIGVFTGPVYAACESAAKSFLNVQAYRVAVLERDNPGYIESYLAALAAQRLQREQQLNEEAERLISPAALSIAAPVAEGVSP